MRGQGSLDSFGTVLSGLAKRLGLQSHLFELRLQQQWGDLVGEPLASHTWPQQIRFKKLSLLVRNSVWLHQLTFLKPTLIATLNQRAGTELVTDITMRVGEIPGPTDPIPGSEKTTDPNPPESLPTAEASSRLAGIQDPEIRRRFTEVIGTYPAQPAQPAAGLSRDP